MVRDTSSSYLSFICLVRHLDCDLCYSDLGTDVGFGYVSKCLICQPSKVRIQGHF